MINVTIAEHKVAFPTKVAAASGSPHIYNIHLTAAHDNGDLVGRGAWEDLDLYTEAAAPNTFAGIIRQKAANGDWYIEVTAATEALFIFDSPVIAENYNHKFTAEKNFYNESGKVVKAYSLIKGDIISISTFGFTGTPKAGKAVSYSNGKYVVAS